MNCRKMLKLLLISFAFSQTVLGDSISIKLGYTRGDITPDRYEYAASLQNKLFNNRRLEAFPALFNYYKFSRKVPDFFREKWIFSLGLNHASLLEKYPGGRLQLTRDTIFYQIGYRLEQDEWITPLKFVAEFSLLNGVSGQVKLKADTGSQTFREEFPLLEFSTQGTVAVEYPLDSQYSISFGAQYYSQASFGLLMGVHYDLQNKKKK